jgi:plastocyanin domain-containing protein
MFKNASVVTLGIAAASVAFSAVACSRAERAAAAPPETHESSPATPAAEREGTGKVVKIAVDGNGFTPTSVTVKKGEPVMLEFTRLTDKTCATSVTLSELNISKDLPLNQPVEIRVPTDIARTLTFTCGMGMLKGTLVIS